MHLLQSKSQQLSDVIIVIYVGIHPSKMIPLHSPCTDTIIRGLNIQPRGVPLTLQMKMEN